MSEDALPDLPSILASILQRVPPGHRPLLIAVAERLAAARYRGWAAGATDDRQRANLLECARREEEIASRVEALDPASARIQRDILAANPDLEETNRALFAGRPVRQQLAIQAQGERLGAATWR